MLLGDWLEKQWFCAEKHFKWLLEYLLNKILANIAKASNIIVINVCQRNRVIISKADIIWRQRTFCLFPIFCVNPCSVEWFVFHLVSFILRNEYERLYFIFKVTMTVYAAMMHYGLLSNRPMWMNLRRSFRWTRNSCIKQ